MYAHRGDRIRIQGLVNALREHEKAFGLGGDDAEASPEIA
jgi:hypothetical protein